MDLAGSEEYDDKRSERKKETVNINQSLGVLARVIQALSNAKIGYVPYRDSNLTRLLKDSLGGNARTCFLACIMSAESFQRDSVRTLSYATRAKEIKNKPKTNYGI